MISERVYRALLLAYPSEHRREYGEPMAQLFRDRMRRDGRGLRTLVVWARMIFDLAGSAFKERKEGAMPGRVTVKRAVTRSAVFLFWSLVGATGLYLLTTVAVLTAGLVSLLTGWYPFAIEAGPLGFLGYTMRIDNATNFAILIESSWTGFFALVAGVGVLIGAGSAVGPLRTSLRSWGDLG